MNWSGVMDKFATKARQVAYSPVFWLPLVLAVLLGTALLWYPPFWQPSYAPVDPDTPFYKQVTAGVDINHASEAELAVLPGIGPSKARAIVEFREENGFFTQPEDLLEVNGIGPTTLEGLEELIVILE